MYAERLRLMEVIDMKKFFAMLLAATMMTTAALAATPTDLPETEAAVETPAEVTSVQETEPAPAAEETPAPVETPAAEETPAPVETPTAEETPAAEDNVSEAEEAAAEETQIEKEKAETADEVNQEAEETAAEEQPAAQRSVAIYAIGEGPFTVGDRVGLQAVLTGYENVNYTLQWQRWNSKAQVWENIAGANSLVLWINTVEGMDGTQWQVVVTVL